MATNYGKDKMKNEEGNEVSDPFAGLTKSQVLQESRAFNDAQINARKCCDLIIKILWLLIQGETFTSNEATGVFFGVTKLFQSQDVTLRRMLYLIIKELKPNETEVIIVTQSLTKDMNSKTDLYRANAIRVLCRILEPAMLQQIERYLQTAIVDKNSLVSSAALVSGIHLLRTAPDIVKRWVNQVQEAVQSKNQMVQFHALALLYEIKKSDRLAVSKVVTAVAKSSVRSPLATCLLVRYSTRVLGSDLDSATEKSLMEFLESSLRGHSEVSIYEAARAICSLPQASPRELTTAVTALQLLLSSPRPVIRFAAVRTLNKVAMTHPLGVTTCNVDLETLISDPNRNIATLAITTLLKTGSEASVDRLMKQISQFMAELPDDFKVVVIDAIRSLCLKFPAKHRVLMNFLANTLREEGGFEYKRAIVDAVLALISDIPETKEIGLSHLCEFIEDCEFTQLSTLILHLLGREGPHTSSPSKYIRFIYNRVILENATVRAAAVSALAKFGASVPSLKQSVIVLLKRCQHDNDDEVRDRATFFLQHLCEDNEDKQLLDINLPVALTTFEQSLEAFKVEYGAAPSQPFSLDMLPSKEEEADAMRRAVVTKPTTHAAANGSTPHAAPSASGAASPSRPAQTQEPEILQKIVSIPQLSHVGKYFHSSRVAELTESEAEYVVNCVKHVFEQHVVLQFNITNTLNDQLLDNTFVHIELTDAAQNQYWDEEAVIPAPPLPYDCPGTSYVCLRRKPTADTQYPFASFSCSLRFTIKEIDASGQADDTGYQDEYPLEGIHISASDYMARCRLRDGDFRGLWEAMSDVPELVQKFSLPFKTLETAVPGVIQFLGMEPCDGTETVPPKVRGHNVSLAGTFVGGIQVLVRASIGHDPNLGCMLKLAVRAGNEAVCQTVMCAIE
eukprot:GILJ01003735.1.p1 GENE.GILJ01003735.1~~GILJ01003735.1.p1  ORF type:complete len:905 (-),score=126.81 GILJ01003735.1:163-2877(-)